MKILIACEESGRVRDAFTDLGHDATSCDLLPSRTLGKHYQGDVRDILYDDWDIVIAFPPCTYLTVTGNRWMKPEYSERFPTRKQDRYDAIEFFMLFAQLKCKYAIENPVGIMSTVWRVPDQIIQPYWFGDPHVKKTCLWLQGLPKLQRTDFDTEPQYKIYRSKKKKSGISRYPVSWSKSGVGASRERGTTFYGIARAMAEQWGNLKDSSENNMCAQSKHSEKK